MLHEVALQGWRMVPLVRKVVQTTALLALLSILPAKAFAQSGNGTLRGLVTDPSGATVPGATVAVTRAPGAVKVATTREDEAVKPRRGGLWGDQHPRPPEARD